MKQRCLVTLKTLSSADTCRNEIQNNRTKLGRKYRENSHQNRLKFQDLDNMTVGVEFWTYESRISHYETGRKQHSLRRQTVHSIKAKRNNLRSSDLFLDEVQKAIYIIEEKEEMFCDLFADAIFRHIQRQIIQKGEDDDHNRQVGHRIVTQLTFSPLVKTVPNTWPQLSVETWNEGQDNLLNIICETLEGIAMLLYLQKYHTGPDEITLHHQSYIYSIDDRFRNAFRILRTIFKESL